MPETILVIKEQPWYSPEAATPVIPRGRTGLDFVIRRAMHEGRWTLALLGVCRLPRRQTLLYGTNATQVIRVVAIDQLTGAVSQNHVSDPHSAPLPVLQKADPPPPVGLEANWIEMNFNIDLADQLGLPPAAAKYAVCAWMEDLISPLQAAFLEEDKTRPGQAGTTAVPSVRSPVNVRKTAKSPEPVGGKIIIARSAPEKPSGIAHVHGSIGAGVLPKAPAGVMARPRHLILLAQTALNRVVAAHSVMLPPMEDETGICAFDFEVASLFGEPPKPQRVYVVAIAGQVASESLIVEPPV